MAPLHLPTLFLLLSAVFLLISPSHSLKCTSQKFTKNKLFANCTDLPSLSAYLHWTYNSTKSSLSVAFIATPAKSDGWIAWAVNPTVVGMLGAQSLIAFKDSKGSMTVKTYNISSYGPVVQSKLSFNVSDLSAEYSGGVMTIFATLALPEKTTSVNQVWQVGGTVTGGVPAKHEMKDANLNAKGPLDLVEGAQSNGTIPGGSSTVPPSPAPSPATANSTSGGVTISGNSKFGFCMLLLIASLVLRF